MFNLDVTHKCLIAECWCAVDDLDRIQQAQLDVLQETALAADEQPAVHRTSQFP